jgi:hypothetical protein
MLSALVPDSDIARCSRHVSKVPIVLKKPSSAAERNFLEPPMRLARADVKDHVGPHKKDQACSYRRDGAL